MKTRTFNFFSDGGHGWLKVSIKDIIKFCDTETISKISRYSYFSKGFAFLEEDCDMDLFAKALNSNGIDVKYKKHHSNKQSKIRNYESFKFELVKA